MARRKKKQGTNFGARTGGGSVDAFKKRERSRVSTYVVASIAAIFVFCFVVWLLSRPASVDTTTEENTGDAAESSLDSLADDFEAESNEEAAGDNALSDEDVADEGFTSEEAVVEEPVEAEPVADTSAAEAIDPDSFSLLPGNFELTDIDPLERNDYYSAMPEMIIDTSKTYEAIIVTERGEMRLRLYDDLAPVTVNNFVSLALDGFYDNTMFHRVIENFMVQAGDPSGTGAGGPGYNFQDEVDNDLSFNRRGLLAMANAGPGTNGSQFFITHVPTDWLTGNHTIFGELIEGDDVLSAIRIRDPQSDPNPGDLVETIEIYVTD